MLWNKAVKLLANNAIIQTYLPIILKQKLSANNAIKCNKAVKLLAIGHKIKEIHERIRHQGSIYTLHTDEQVIISVPGGLLVLRQPWCSPFGNRWTIRWHHGVRVLIDTLISIMTVFFFLDKKNSSSNSGAKVHRFGLCSQRSV